ncbi:MAG: hypothetical protein QXY40_02710 [Candidatus Methanomethylicia archaeon]
MVLIYFHSSRMASDILSFIVTRSIYIIVVYLNLPFEFDRRDARIMVDLL